MLAHCRQQQLFVNESPVHLTEISLLWVIPGGGYTHSVKLKVSNSLAPEDLAGWLTHLTPTNHT